MDQIDHRGANPDPRMGSQVLVAALGLPVPIGDGVMAPQSMGSQGLLPLTGLVSRVDSEVAGAVVLAQIFRRRCPSLVPMLVLGDSGSWMGAIHASRARQRRRILFQLMAQPGIRRMLSCCINRNTSSSAPTRFPSLCLSIASLSLSSDWYLYNIKIHTL